MSARHHHNRTPLALIQASHLVGSERATVVELHERVRALCHDACTRRGRTWERLPLHDRRQRLGEALERLTNNERALWTRYASLGDV